MKRRQLEGADIQLSHKGPCSEAIKAISPYSISVLLAFLGNFEE